MDTSKLKKFAQYARRSLIEQVQSKLRLVLAQDSAARREYPHAVKELEAKQKEFGDDKLLIEQVAYTWFNRFCALRFMDANQYNRIMVVSPIAGQFQPEILAEAKAGHLDESVFDANTSDKIRGLLSGVSPSRDGQAEAYRLIIVGVCNDYHRLMPYLFERIEDYTELLMPEDLLSGNSILAYTREAMTPENCESVETIGWLYQFYISEKKDQVFEGLKKNKKITPENIPAATQLFTPHWIVKYLVENSLGRLWMLNNPSSKVIEQMDYYIKPVEEENDFLKISTPEELKICDPAAGSGHMLTYAYDLLYAIYLDANYDPVDIPELILTKNLYGIEIDERAAELAAFALSMKAMKGNPFDDSNNRRRFFRNPIKPNICRLEKVTIDEDALEEYIEFAGNELFTSDVLATLKEFEEADNFGSLIQPTLKEPTELLEKLASKDAQVDLFLKDTHESILKILKQAKYLSPIYHAVIANPPYMGNKGMNARLDKWVKTNYRDSKADLYACFIERNLSLAMPKGQVGMITMHAWMFITSFEKLRIKLLNNSTINSLAHLGTRAFDSIGGEVVSTVAFILESNFSSKRYGNFLRLIDGKSEKDKRKSLLDIVLRVNEENLYHVQMNEFSKISGYPIAYWIPENIRNLFVLKEKLGDIVEAGNGLQTNDNQLYLKYWHEVSYNKVGLGIHSRSDAQKSNKKWFPYNKGGQFKKWFGNEEYVINWQNDGFDIKERKKNDLEAGKITPNNSKCWNEQFYFKKAVTWSDVTSGDNAFRVCDGFLFDITGPSAFPNKELSYLELLSFLNSPISSYLTAVLNPTMHFNVGNFRQLPAATINSNELDSCVSKAIEISRDDWNSSEMSWNFATFPILELKNEDSLLESAVRKFLDQSIEVTLKLKEIEESINETYLNCYDLKGELESKVGLENITLIRNPHFRFSGKNTKEPLIELAKRDVLQEFISYFVGCLFGRYSIDKSGIIIGSQNEMLDKTFAQILPQSYVPDADNVVPIIDFEGDWFEDDISDRFKEYLKVTFGEERFTENLAFIEEAIGKDIKKYFVKDFYDDHVKRYKKRPIYWMFSSPKGSFNALIYMHRYQPDTVSIVLNDYLREFRTKLEARKESYEQVEISASASQKDKTNAIKAISKINKVLEEINDYEHDVLYPLAGEKIEIDLDDGVKHNYPLFGKALKKITGLS
ncbi:BREX-1 system adenine-specific DNA-methyltransferase PglX [Pseudoalteromonas xiamenensis]